MKNQMKKTAHTIIKCFLAFSYGVIGVAAMAVTILNLLTFKNH